MQRGRAYCCAATRPYAHVWKMIWAKQDDLGVSPGDNLRITNVKAHLTDEQMEKLPPVCTLLKGARWHEGGGSVVAGWREGAASTL